MNGNRAQGTIRFDGKPIAEVTGIEIRMEADNVGKFKVGDKVRMIDKSRIIGGGKAVNGREYTVLSVNADGDICIDEMYGGTSLVIYQRELHAIELVKEDANMTKFNVGDRVTFINNGGYSLEDNQQAGEIVNLHEDISDLYLVAIDNYITLNFHADELRLEAKHFKTEKRHAKVGERILITDAGVTLGYYRNGDILTISDDDYSGGVAVVSPEECPYINHDEYEVIVEESVTQTLETRVTELEAEVSALRAHLTKPKQVVEYEFVPVKKTPNQRRADVINRARAFVADLEERAANVINEDGNPMFNRRTTRLSFHVNAEKGVVTALAHGKHGGKLFAKAFAKCSPGDVFNADIGKAIAAGRLYGVKVPEDYLDAPKPAEAVDGQIVTFPKLDDWYRKVNYRVDGVGERSDDLEVVRDGFDGDVGMRAHMGDGLGRLVIIDDTEAQY